MALAEKQRRILATFCSCRLHSATESSKSKCGRQSARSAPLSGTPFALQKLGGAERDLVVTALLARARPTLESSVSQLSVSDRPELSMPVLAAPASGNKSAGEQH